MQKVSKILWWILGVLIIALFLSLYFSYHPQYIYRTVHKLWPTHYYRHLRASETDTIQLWMTFDYINKVFKLPPSYLKNNFQITDSHYPNITLDDYADDGKIAPTVFLFNIRASVHNYLIQP